MALRNSLPTFVTILICTLCLSAHENAKKVYNNETILKDLDSLINTKYILDISKDDTVINLNLHNLRLKRNTNESLFYNELNNKTNKEIKADLNDKDKMVANRSDLIVDTTEYYDVNSTEEPCVGDPEFCNMTKEEYMEMLNDYIYPQPYEWVLIATHAIVFVIGLIGNALVCIAVYRNHSMRTVTNYFIVNLAVADFMVILICLPPTVLWDVTETWFFGTAMCRIVLYFQVCNFF